MAIPLSTLRTHSGVSPLPTLLWNLCQLSVVSNFQGSWQQWKGWKLGGVSSQGLLFASTHSCQRKGLFLTPTAKKQSKKGAGSACGLGTPGLLGSSAQSIQHALHGPPSETSFYKVFGCMIGLLGYKFAFSTGLTVVRTFFLSY